MSSIIDSACDLQEVLDALDAAADALGGGPAEQLQELNAEFEDALFMLQQIDLRDSDAPEQLDDALDEFVALRDDLCRIAGTGHPTLIGPLDRLSAIVDAACKSRQLRLG